MDLKEIGDLGKPNPEVIEDALISRVHQFRVIYPAPDGQTLEETVTSTILNGDQRAQLPVAAVRYANAERWDSLPITQQARFWALAMLSLQLSNESKALGKWVQEDDNLLFTVFGELQDHERRYFRRGLEKGEAGEEKSSIRILPAVITKPPA